jgi:hypothetical protein
MVGCAAVGFADDYIKIVRKRSLGRRDDKILGLSIVGALVGAALSD